MCARARAYNQPSDAAAAAFFAAAALARAAPLTTLALRLQVPIRFSKPIRERMLQLGKAKGMSKKLGLLSGLKMKDLAPEAPGIANFTTGEVMGHSSDRLADKFGVSRIEQDEFALRSHHNAAAAHAAGIYDDEIIPFQGSTEETGECAQREERAERREGWREGGRMEE